MSELRFQELPVGTIFRHEGSFYKKLGQEWTTRIPIPEHFSWLYPKAVVEIEEPDENGLYHWPAHQDIGRSRAVRSKRQQKTDRL